MAAIGYLNQVGLPDFAKRELQERLAKRGIELEFDWLRLELNGAWKAKWLRLGQADSAGKLSLAIQDVHVRPNYQSLISGAPSLEELGLSGLGLGAALVADGTNLPPITVNLPKAGVRWGDTGIFSTEGLEGEVLGVQMGISLNVTNALELRELPARISGKPKKEPKSITPESLSRALRPIKDGLAEFLKRRDEIGTDKQPVVQLALGGDAAVPETLSGGITIKAGRITTPAATVGQFELGLNLLNDDSAGEGAKRLSGTLAVSDLVTERAKLKTLTGEISSPALGTNLLPATLEYQLSAGEVDLEQMQFKSGG